MVDIGVRAQLNYSGDWQAVRTYERDVVDMTWGLSDEGSALGLSRAGITLDNRSNAYNPDDARSSLYGLIGRNTPARIRLGVSTYTLISGAVDSWDPDHDINWSPATGLGGDSWTKIRIAGPSAKINASKTVRSALRRTIDAMTAAGTGPAGYWPMEGFDRQPDVVPSAVPGVDDGTHRQFTGVNTTSAFNWSGDATLPGSQNLPTLESNNLGQAGIATNGIFVPAPALGSAMWTRTAIPDTDQTHGIIAIAMQTLTIDGGPVVFRVRLDTFPPGSIGAAVPADGEVRAAVYYYNEATGTSLASVQVNNIPFVDGWRQIYARMSTSGSDVAVSIMVDGAVVGTGTLTGASLGSRITKFSTIAIVQDTVGQVESGRISLGQSVLLLDSTANMDAFALVHYEAGTGYPGETTSDRFVRVLAEASITGTVIGTDPHDMGPQVPATLSDLLGEIARTELGLIFDSRDSYEMVLRTGRSLYNQTAALALTYGVNVHPPIRPATDGLNIANDVTAKGRSGAVARRQRTSGPLNVNDPLDDSEGIGRVEGGADVNPASDADLPDTASWLLHVSSWPGARYRNVTVSLIKHPELTAAVMALQPGDLITIDDLDADQVRLLALGGAHAVRSVDHLVTFNCTPEGPYQVGDLTASPTRLMGSSTSSLAADFDAGTDTSMSVAVTGALWTNANVPFHIRVGGVVLNVTAISGASSPQTFTVDATPVNGIIRTILAAGPTALARVDIADPVYIGA